METTDKASELHSIYAQAMGGSETYYKWSILFRNCKLSTGMKLLCDAAGAYWLADAIASYQPKLQKNWDLHNQQYWTLKVEDGSAVLTCRETPIRQKFDLTDFPSGEWKFRVGPAYYGQEKGQFNIIICLPTEQ